MIITAVRSFFLQVTLVISSLGVASLAFATPMSSTDLWQSQFGAGGGTYGSRVTGTSGTKIISASSNIGNMFGDTGGVEGGNTIFKDFYYPGGVRTLVPDGYVHWVEWNTAANVNLLSFALHAANEQPNDPSPARSFSRFTLYAGDGAGNWNEFYDVLTSPLFQTVGQNGFLDLQVDLAAPVIAQYFRAEFVGIRPTVTTIGNSGPRIQELDGFATFADGSTYTPPLTAVPLPSALVLMLTGLLGIGGVRSLLPRSQTAI